MLKIKIMKKRITKKLPAFISIITFSILIFNGSCSKDTKSPDTGNTTTGTSKIVYTDVKPDSAILSTTDSFNLDLNNDGIPDFEFQKSIFIMECGHNPEVPPTHTFSTKLSVTPTRANNAIIASVSNFSLVLDSAASINPDSLWGIGTQILFEVTATSYCGVVSEHGYWLNVADKYIGLKFIKGNNTYYGWARLSSTYSASSSSVMIGDQLILKDYAYNSIPNQPILAGQTK